MRIISGKWRGRKLSAFKAPHIRPTTDRVKEVIFNKLQFDIDGARVLDLFAGTGNLSFESLSRGAKEVISVESHPKSLSLIEKNRSLFKDTNNLTVFRSDVIKYLNRNSMLDFDIVLIDPPFTKALSDEVLKVLSESGPLNPNVRVFIESSSQEEVEETYGDLVCKTCLAFGDKFLREFRIS